MEPSTTGAGHAPSQVSRRSALPAVTTWAKGIAGIVAFALLWDLLRLTNVLSPDWAPSSVSILGAFVQEIANQNLLRPIWETLSAWALGLIIGASIGIAWGGAMGASRTVAGLSSIVVSFLRPVPAVALIPIAIFIAGLGLPMILLVVAFATIWPVLFNTYYGVRDVPEQFRETSFALGKSELETFFRVTLVAAAPSIVTGVRISAGVGLVVTVATQLVTSGGLGGYVLVARTSGRIDLGYAGLLAGGLLGVLVNAVFVLVQKRALAWSPEYREGEE